MPEDSAPLVTVITPCLNTSAWLPACIESVARQTVDSIEHIVIDGGSTDGTLEVLARHPQITWQSEPDSGQSEAINKGIALARGELVTWLNADDTLEPSAVEAVLAAWRARPDGSVFYGDCAIVEGGTTRVWAPSPWLRTADFEGRDPLPQVGTFVTRRALTAVGGVDEKFHLAMDYDLFLRLTLAGHRFVYVPKVLARFLLHESSKSGSIDESRFLREEALALEKSGQTSAAHVALGRAAAHDARRPDGSWPRSFWRDLKVRPRDERAGAHLEAARCLAREGSPLLLPRVIAHACDPAVWVIATTRRNLTRTMMRLPQRLVHHGRGSRW